MAKTSPCLGCWMSPSACFRCCVSCSTGTETIKPVLLPVPSVWRADWSFGHVHGVGKDYVVQGQDGSFTQPSSSVLLF